MTQEVLAFWAIGDLHHNALPAWNEFHTRRLREMYSDLQALWQEGDAPAFCVFPGDLVEFASEKNCQLAQETLTRNLNGIPFYVGPGNHEFYAGIGNTTPLSDLLALYHKTWNKPLRYHWTTPNATFIMLDYPSSIDAPDPHNWSLTQETLTYLETTLATHPAMPAIIFLHSPLSNTVLARDEAGLLDYHSLEGYFAPNNSQAVRAILARHRHACLFISGHTHSGWEAPHLVLTELCGESQHPMTFVNLMSPWYTGKKKGLRVNADGSVTYVADEPDVMPSFSFQLFEHHALIRLRDHKARMWLKTWSVPLV